jgi:soluble lytic murein transglycosylase
MRRLAIISSILLMTAVIALSWLYCHTSRYDDAIRQAAARNGLDFYLVKALIFEESWFRPEIHGSAGELGLMQITPAAAADFSVQKGFPVIHESRMTEPELNIEIGCWYLSQSMILYKDTPQPTLFALLRYNAGESRADDWLNIVRNSSVPKGIAQEDYYLSMVNFPKTRTYVRRILKRSRNHNYWF